MASDEMPVRTWLSMAAAVALVLAIPVGLYALWAGAAMLMWGLVLWLIAKTL